MKAPRFVASVVPCFMFVLTAAGFAQSPKTAAGTHVHQTASTPGGVAISDSATGVADGSAILDVQVYGPSKKGVLVPRMTASERVAISAPAAGLLVYQTDAAAGFYFYNGSTWTALNGGGSALNLPFTGSVSKAAWGLSVTNHSSGSGVIALSDSGNGLFSSSTTGEGLHAQSDSSSGIGAYGKYGVVASSSAGHSGYLGGPGVGVWGQNSNSNYAYLGGKDYCVYAYHNATGNQGMMGTASWGMSGQALLQTSQTYGVYGITTTPGYGSSGVYGASTSTTGTTYGVYGTISTTTAGSAAVYGLASATSGITQGIYGENDSNAPGASGIIGWEKGTGGGYGVIGQIEGVTDGSSGVFGTADGTSGVTNGVYGYNRSSNSGNAGVDGESPAGYGVKGIGGNIGVYAHNTSGTPGRDVYLATGSLAADMYGDVYVHGNVTATAFNPSSDRNLKENFSAVDPASILTKVAALPVQTWNYKSDPASLRHIGPMAQDFSAAFHVGMDDKHIATVDADGVALAAIQGLYELLQKDQVEIARLREENERLREEFAGLKGKVESLTQVSSPGQPAKAQEMSSR